ncbi:MAG: hypothetical protein HQ581_21310 [Planctomycetes bacterium]|nr:hypothetical protein [Planctomycetota bacterium]
MLRGEPVSDNEVLLRRIPPGAGWFEPPDYVTSANFKLRRDENGLSVYRQNVVGEQEVLNKPGAISGSFVLKATAREIRGLQNAMGDPLGLDVVAVDDADDPGHAEIRGPNPGKLSGGATKAIRNLFAGSYRQP